MSISFVLRRFVVFLVIVWAAATINFFIPRLAPGDPIAGILQRMQNMGSSMEGADEVIKHYREVFGFDDPLPVQYAKYMMGVARGDLGLSVKNFPNSVVTLIGRSLPYSIGLFGTAVLLSCLLGLLVGALMAWPGTNKVIKTILPTFMVLGAIPYYLVAMVLIFLFAYTLNWFPSGGISQIGSVNRAGSLAAVLDLLYHSILPAISLILASMGGWALGMRAMMIVVLGEDYLTLAEAKGLPERSIFLRYAVRNAILPQVTAFAISLGYIVSGGVLVEQIFGYPGIGLLLSEAIQGADYPVIQGISILLVVAVAGAVFILDLIYPLLDPRIRYEK